MAIEKNVNVDQIEVSRNGVVHVRTATVILENNVEISRSYHRHIIAPGQDYSSEEKSVRDICGVAHTPDVISSYLDKLKNQIIH